MSKARAGHERKTFFRVALRGSRGHYCTIFNCHVRMNRMDNLEGARAPHRIVLQNLHQILQHSTIALQNKRKISFGWGFAKGDIFACCIICSKFCSRTFVWTRAPPQLSNEQQGFKFSTSLIIPIFPCLAINVKWH